MSTVGIAIPAYGRGRHLAATLDSVLTQTRRADQVIVVDDCSPDETGEVARRYESRGIIYQRNPKNLGVPFNYNHSLSQLTTDYVMLLEDHDLISPDFIERSARLLDENPDMTVVSSYIGEIEEATGRLLRVYESDFPEVGPGRKLSEYIVTKITAPFGLVALIRRSALEGLEPWFNPKYWWYADVDLWIKLGLRGSFGYIHAPILQMRQREAKHFLDSREWQSITVCDRIRADNWAEVFPGVNPSANAKRVAYRAARDFQGLKQALSQLARGDRNIPPEAHEMMTPLGRAALSLAMKMPVSAAQLVRAAHHKLVPRS